jgi:hypothetical protein
MRLPQEYPSEPLIEAITALDWRVGHAEAATKVIQLVVAERFGEQLDEEDAVWILGSLLNRRLIRAEFDPEELLTRRGDLKRRPRARYVRIPLEAS